MKTNLIKVLLLKIAKTLSFRVNSKHKHRKYNSVSNQQHFANVSVSRKCKYCSYHDNHRNPTTTNTNRFGETTGELKKKNL